MKGFRPKTPAEREPYNPKAESAAWTRYYREARRMGRAWLGCMACPPERRDPKAITEVHHVVSQRKLKDLYRHLNPWKLLQILTDPRNSMILDESCHAAHIDGTQTGRLPRRAIPSYAWDFAAEHGLTEHVKEEYPA